MKATVWNCWASNQTNGDHRKCKQMNDLGQFCKESFGIGDVGMGDARLQEHVDYRDGYDEWRQFYHLANHIGIFGFGED